MKQTRSIQAGFSLLELTVVFAVIALLGAFVVPNLFRAKQGIQRKEFVASFESLLKDAVLRSILENKMHQIFIDITHEVIQTREYNAQSIETREHLKFARVLDADYLTEIKFPKRFAIQDFFINGIQEFHPGTETFDVGFYVMPDGTSQAIIANLIDQDEDGIDPEVKFSFVINPFYARMSVYETFQTP
ncbi:MAG: type II secretion system protein [Candidatus Chromulinivorax sp.]|nr:type II secretion system protein [Candidatus Chromulinivorax sp.]